MRLDALVNIGSAGLQNLVEPRLAAGDEDLRIIVQKVAGNLFTYAEEAGSAFQFLGFEGKPAGYFVMFCYCGVAYLIAWVIMKSLVPKYKPIEL